MRISWPRITCTGITLPLPLASAASRAAARPAGLAHLQGGDVIISLAERPVDDLAGLAAALEAALANGNGSVIPVQVIRGQEIRILYLERYWLTEKP